MTPTKFLAELKRHDSQKYAIVTSLRMLILEQQKDISEEVKYGGLYYSLNKPFTGLFVYKNHVMTGFANGAKLNDPANLLLGTGKYRRHLKLTSVEEIDEKQIKKLLQQALEIDKQ